jgi:uncharacterized membrane protein YhaH (DUF805 family)
MLAVQIKRWHDINKSGWFCLLSLLPYIGLVISIVIGFLPGNIGPNRFGPDPFTRAAPNAL